MDSHKAEIRREFAPYVGVSWIHKLGDAVDFAQDEGRVSVICSPSWEFVPGTDPALAWQTLRLTAAATTHRIRPPLDLCFGHRVYI
ncbi:MAG: copper resistance protein B [Thiogranum sp.]|nr:copper resistance protein B [Thiogranum sp.]